LDLETRFAVVVLLRAFDGSISSERSRIAARRLPLMRLICLPEFHLRTPAPHWFGAPASRFGTGLALDPFASRYIVVRSS